MLFIPLIGRILFSSFFLLSVMHLFSPEAAKMAASNGFNNAHIIMPIAGVIAFLGGLSILLGYKARLGAWFVVVFLIVMTYMLHPFWMYSNQTRAMMETVQFMKNISLLGGALMIAYFGSGPMSLKN